MKPKYQDTVKDYRPTIPLKSIKQKYTPTQSYVSQDNRSNWQHEQDAEMADRSYKQQMEDRKMQEGLHNLNGFLTFTDYAGLATGVGGLVSKGVKQLVKRGAKRAVKNRFKSSSINKFISTKAIGRGTDDIKFDIHNFLEYINKPETKKKLISIDSELGTQYTKAVGDFSNSARQGKLNIFSRKPGQLGLDGEPVVNPQTLTAPEMITNPSYHNVAFDFMNSFPSHSVGHEFKHGIEGYHAALTYSGKSLDEAISMNPRIQALMKNNIVSEEQFMKSVKPRFPRVSEDNLRKEYRYLSTPTEFNSQLHPLVELSQRSGKSGLPNFKSPDEIEQLLRNGMRDGQGVSRIHVMFNNLIKDKDLFTKQFNKYGWGLTAPILNFKNNKNGR